MFLKTSEDTVKNIRWKIFLAVAKQEKKSVTSYDVERRYREVIDPLAVELEPHFEEFVSFIKKTPGFTCIGEGRFTISELDALEIFKEEALKDRPKEKTAETKEEVAKNTKKPISAPRFKHDILEHYICSPPTPLGFPENLKDEVVVKKAFEQFKAILLLHSRTIRLFDDVLFLFTADHFSRAYQDRFFEEIDLGKTGFRTLQDFLEWLPELQFNGGDGTFSVSTIYKMNQRTREEDEAEMEKKWRMEIKKEMRVKKEEVFDEDFNVPAKKSRVKEELKDDYPRAMVKGTIPHQKNTISPAKVVKQELDEADFVAEQVIVQPAGRVHKKIARNPNSPPHISIGNHHPRDNEEGDEDNENDEYDENEAAH